MVFDLLALGDLSMFDVPLVRRKELLAKIVRAPGVLRVLDHLPAGPDKLFAFCRENKLEGIVSKRADGPYRPGPARSGDWVKTKCEQEASFVVVGYTKSESVRGKLRGLDLASFEDGDLVVRGRVGSGLADAEVDALLASFAPLVTDAPTARGEYEAAPAGRVHLRPEVVVRVRFLEWSDGGRLRFPVYLGRDAGADPQACRTAPHDEEHVEAPQAAPHDAEKIAVRITNRSKVFWPAEGYKKGDLVDYYEAVAPVLLPYLADRPVMLVRYPDGIEGKSFYQWNVPHGMPAWMKSVVLGKHVYAPQEGDDKKHVFIVDRPESLAYLANLACIPIHILASRTTTPDQADFLTIDFDVRLLGLPAAIEQAHTLREILASVGLTGFPKTSGQTGLHVFVPLGPGVSPTAARTLADLLGRMLVERHPTTATMERVVQRRGAKVYVDTGQTGPSRTIVAPYSVRATPGARVSAPLAWEELTENLDPAQYTIRTVPRRIQEVGDPMAPLLAAKPDMGAVMERLGAALGRPR
jgi:bifunctional non-homologous end joining protein LigD